MEQKNNPTCIRRRIAVLLICVLIASAGVGTGYLIGAKPLSAQLAEQTGYAANPVYEYMVGSAAWQMSAEAHALMIQSFHIAEENVSALIHLADNELNGYRWVEENGQKKLYLDDKRVCVVCDIDDTLVDGVHYTANILGKNGEWTNKAFTDFVQSEGCTALPGAVLGSPREPSEADRVGKSRRK